MSLTTARAQSLNLSNHVTRVSGGHQGYQEPSLLPNVCAQLEDERFVISFSFLSYKSYSV